MLGKPMEVTQVEYIQAMLLESCRWFYEIQIPPCQVSKRAIRFISLYGFLGFEPIKVEAVLTEVRFPVVGAAGYFPAVGQRMA